MTDGETNATIPKSESVDDIEFARAVELLAEKRAKGPAKPRTTARSTAKKPAARKAAPKKK